MKAARFGGRYDRAEHQDLARQLPHAAYRTIACCRALSFDQRRKTVGSGHSMIEDPGAFTTPWNTTSSASPPRPIKGPTSKRLAPKIPEFSAFPVSRCRRPTRRISNPLSPILTPALKTARHSFFVFRFSIFEFSFPSSALSRSLPKPRHYLPSSAVKRFIANRQPPRFQAGGEFAGILKRHRRGTDRRHGGRRCGADRIFSLCVRGHLRATQIDFVLGVRDPRSGLGHFQARGNEHSLRAKGRWRHHPRRRRPGSQDPHGARHRGPSSPRWRGL